ncbi:MAG: hypothetical protein ILA24_00965 [Ruminococcus sp.]|nr:hypothetical protein [Ruminococcus sp.]
MCSCDEDSSSDTKAMTTKTAVDSKSVTESEHDAIKGAEPSHARVNQNSSEQNTDIPIEGEWRALQLKEGSDTETNDSFKFVFLFGKDGQYRVTYEKAKKFEYKDDSLYLYDDGLIEYLKYSVQATENGYLIIPIAFSYQNVEYNIKDYNNKYKLDPTKAPLHFSAKPSYKLLPYDGCYQSAEEEYKQSLEIVDLKILNLAAKYVYNAVDEYFHEHGTNRSGYSEYAGEYSQNDTRNELSEVITGALTETKSMDVKCCLVIVLNEDSNKNYYYVQTKAEGHSQIGQYPEPRVASFDNPALSSDIVYGTYTRLPE